MPVKQEVANTLSGTWKIGLFEAPCKAPVQFCYGCCCMCCMAGQQRGQILDFIQEPYVCCGGLFPCGPLGQPQDRNCMWCEAFCCPGCAISGNRFIIQTRFDKMNTACDDCLIWTVIIVHFVVCIAQMFMDVPDEIENCVDLMAMIVDGCMLAQQQVELEHVKSIGWNGPNPAIMSAVGPKQAQLMQQGRPQQQNMAYAGATAVPMGRVMG